ncbi:MAG: cysteine synthase A [Clostridium tyrobutyricum]|jgi:cysteine synthase A|uniref:cysteine synthase A n=1 Tax=Clostridium tyrobutyricum TaxID=1519 RepID=UPI0002D875A0|nr:cysteine synthase A [Clostridium tyrobutyricum]MBV4436656.1 cysteine synthase A [Clostridium tyrobutyricum]MCH4200230.1 cysteine synthase A [Clostridium tyrobutyricum]MCH4236997.1 cysteine synthase A [Clostridium tyrobutyricum]MCH4258389.1 cysteine synthase A [Clostridium tyrobutyricum]MCI1238478.1 cysteine synthase A [Clostridium tyrobutyricum]
MIFENAIDLIGNTPLLKLNNLKVEGSADVYLKLEKFNPGGSIKDRAALGMIEKAEKNNLIKKGDTIVEPTSGNTGIALAMIGKLKGYNVIIVMPETMSIERRNTIKAYGAELVLTDGTKGMKGAIEKAYEIAKDKPGYYIPQQFINIANPQKHYETTAEEILKDLNKVDVFIAGVGTGGTLAGVGENLKKHDKSTKVVAVEPASSPVLSGGQTGPHKIQGIGAGFIPDIYKPEIVDQIITVSDENAFEYARLVAKEEGILVGISSGANVYAALELAKKLGSGKTVVTVAPDGGEKYLSMGLYK